MELPGALVDAVEALDHPARRRIIEYLYDHEEATYTELLRMLGVRKGSLTYHLRIMTTAAVIYMTNGEDFTPHKSFYQISPWGESVVDGLMSSFGFLVNPRKKQVPVASESTDNRKTKEAIEVLREMQGAVELPEKKVLLNEARVKRAV